MVVSINGMSIPSCLKYITLGNAEAAICVAFSIGKEANDTFE